MLPTRHRLTRNPYFHFHPLHTAFSLLGALIRRAEGEAVRKKISEDFLFAKFGL
jgi:hypothetical protein